MSDPLEGRLAQYIAARMPTAAQVAVSGLAKITGGASRETYRFRLDWEEGGEARHRPLILRRDPPASLIETERRVEFAAYRAFAGTAVPVPEMLWLEEDPAHLGAPFFVAEEVTGCQASPHGLWSPALEPKLAQVAQAKWSILGAIHRADPGPLGGLLATPAPGDCWRRELDHWEAELDAHEAEPLPITRAAIRWLRANPPPPAQRVGVVHGDFRTGNFLYDGEGEIRAVLDWEMAHLGDPLEDLGWSFNPVWSFGRGLPGGVAPREAAIAAWESASGLRADPAALHWWELFNCVKGQGIWVSSAAAWRGGKNRDPVLVYAAWAMINAQDRATLKVMGKL